MRLTILACLAICPSLLLGELTPAQRETDFRQLANVMLRHYGPMNWKYEVFRYDGLDLSPWLPRVAAARNDLEFLDICAEYVAALDDGHTAFRTISGFTAELGLNVDIYDGKVLIETVNRARYPLARFPFERGDELVSLDGRSAEEWITYFSRFRKLGNPSSTRRQAASAIVARSQITYPSAAIVGDTATAEIRRANGEIATYTLTWNKQGVPVLTLSPLPDIRARQAGVNLATRGAEAEGNDVPADERALAALRNWSVDPTDPLLDRFQYTDAEGNEKSESWVLGWGSVAPVWSFPASYNFQRRLGGSMFDPFTTGVYQFQGKRIGYLRIPSFGASAAVLPLFDNEMRFLKANTDGLVVDVMRNTGGGCIGVDYLLRLIPRRITIFREQFRVTQSWLFWAESNLQAAEARRAEPWVINTWRFYVNMFRDTYKDNRAMSGPVPQCFTANSGGPIDEWEPLRDAQGQLAAYDKPIIMLTDEFSVSFGDIFPAMFQDNKGGTLVGTRTAGWGAQNSLWNAGFYSEASTSVSRTLVERFTTVNAPGYPSRNVIENIGVHPEVPLEYMTRDNLMQNGAPFVEAFSRVLLGRIQ
jgi:hypothetical protein